MRLKSLSTVERLGALGIGECPRIYMWVELSRFGLEEKEIFKRRILKALNFDGSSEENLELVAQFLVACTSGHWRSITKLLKKMVVPKLFLDGDSSIVFVNLFALFTTFLSLFHSPPFSSCNSFILFHSPPAIQSIFLFFIHSIFRSLVFKCSH